MITSPQKSTKVISLNQVMAFKHPGLVSRLQTKLGLSPEDAEMLFQDVKRFLFLCATSDQRVAPPKMVDEGWHHFILFTLDYQRFCAKFLGKFIHHTPWTGKKRTRGQNVLITSSNELATKAFGNSLSKFWVYSAECTNCNCTT
jgi:hypothetical protein